jgi:hypothetical protein
MWRTTPILIAALLGGCVKSLDGDFCLLAAPMYFETSETVEWLSREDPRLLRDIVAHNEILEQCR